MTLIRITPDKRRIKSIIEMSSTNLKIVGKIDPKEFPSYVLKEYYEVIRELISAKMMQDGHKTYGEGSHKEIIDYIKEKGYLDVIEADLVNRIRIFRNYFVYEGKAIEKDFLEEKLPKIRKIIERLLAITK